MSTYAINTFAGDGSTVEFTITFDYISRDHVEVYRVDNDTAAETELTVIESGVPTGDQYVWDTDEQITVGTAPTASETLKVIRDTPENEQIVQWRDGSYIIAEDLNTSDKQWLYGLQELEDQVSAIDGQVSGEAVKRVTGVAPVEVDDTNEQEPAVSVDETVSTDDPNDLTSDTTLMSELAIDNAFKQHIGTAPATGNKIGQIRIDDTATPQDAFWWNGTAWVALTTEGPQGPQGPAGPPPGLQDPSATATTIPNNPDGSVGDATAVVSQDAESDLQFQFGIPQGERGPQGPQGTQGPPGDGVTYLGPIDATTAAEPTDPANGDFYVNTTAGTSTWTGLSTVGVNDRLIWNEATSQWDRFIPADNIDLAYEAAADGGTVTNTNGSGFDIPVVDATNAGLMTPAQLTTLETDPTLQSVLDEGNTSSTTLTIGADGNNSTIGQGTGTFTGKVTSAATEAADADDTLTTKDYVDANSISQNDADARYLRLDAGAPDQTRVSGEATFSATTTHAAGISVTGGTGAAFDTGIKGDASGDSLDFTIDGNSSLYLEKNILRSRIYIDGSSGATTTSGVSLALMDVSGDTAAGQHKYNYIQVIRNSAVNDKFDDIKVLDIPGGAVTGPLNDVAGNTGYGVYSDVPSATNASIYNFYAAGTASNYMRGALAFGQDFQQQASPLAANSTAQTIVYSSQISICQDGGNISNAGLHINRVGSTADGTCFVRLNRLGVLIGSIRSSSSNSVEYWTGPSDYRLKTNVVDLPSATEQIKALRPVDFVFKNAPDEPHVGFIAHEVQEVIPMAASGEKDAVEEYGILTEADGTIQYDIEKPEAVPFGATFESKGTRIKPQSVNQDKLIPYLVKALQEALGEIDSLKERLDALEGA